MARLALVLFLASLSPACSCSEAGAPPGGDDGGGVPDGGGAPDASEPDALVCTGGTICGHPAACCPSGNECVDDACLPACASGVRCGAALDVCCDAGQVCIAGECTVPGASCGDSYDCMQPGEFCEPTLGACLPQPDPITCRYVPDFTTLDVTVEWSFTTDEIISLPVVANLDADANPEVVVNVTRQGGGGWPVGNIVVLDGRTGAEALRIPHDPAAGRYGSHGRSTIAIGDVSGDSVPDIVYASRELSGVSSLVVAVDATGAPLWTSHYLGGTPFYVRVENGGATLANLDADPQAEVVFGALLIDHDGTVFWDAAGGNGEGGIYGSNASYRGGISAVADLDGDDKPEIVSGKHAWKVAWPAAGPPTVTPFWTYPGNDGYPGVADMDGNGTPEVVLVASSQVMVLNGQTGALFAGPIMIPGPSTTNNRGGPPTIADFDGDGAPEIGVAGGYSYSVYDLAGSTLTVKWSRPTQDLSSNCSGSSVFDFQGDGAAEVVYADECYLRVYDGTDGTVQLELPSSSATIHEYPLVVDIDGDGNSEIVIVANDGDGNCTGIPGYVGRRGLYVYGDANDEWVPTRRVWTQHTYHVTNASSDGNVPMLEADNWSSPGLNNYRQNVQGEGVFNAPDLTVDLSIAVDPCLTGMLELRARVSNRGDLGVAAGVDVRFYEGTDATGPLLGTATTSVPLLPGNSTTVTLTLPAPAGLTDYYVEVDGGLASSAVGECNESNNGDTLLQTGCGID